MKWISVKDRLPDDMQKILIAYPDKRFKDMAYSINNCTFSLITWNQSSYGKYFTHWMPLPEPPGKTEDKDRKEPPPNCGTCAWYIKGDGCALDQRQEYCERYEGGKAEDKAECPECGGTGIEKFIEGAGTCGTCNGTGKRTQREGG